MFIPGDLDGLTPEQWLGVLVGILLGGGLLYLLSLFARWLSGKIPGWAVVTIGLVSASIIMCGSAKLTSRIAKLL